MALINFRPNEEDIRILNSLSKSMGLTVAAVIRQAIRLLYKKEIPKEKNKHEIHG